MLRDWLRCHPLAFRRTPRPEAHVSSAPSRRVVLNSAPPAALIPPHIIRCALFAVAPIASTMFCAYAFGGACPRSIPCSNYHVSRCLRGLGQSIRDMMEMDGQREERPFVAAQRLERMAVQEKSSPSPASVYLPRRRDKPAFAPPHHLTKMNKIIGNQETRSFSAPASKRRRGHHYRCRWTVHRDCLE